MLEDEIINAIRSLEAQGKKTSTINIVDRTSEVYLPVHRELRRMYKEKLLDTTDDGEYYIRKGAIAHCDCPGDCNH